MEVANGVTVLELAVGYTVAILPPGLLLLKANGWTALAYATIPFLGTALGLVGLWRLAKPHSWWARHLYGDEKMRTVRARFPEAPMSEDTSLVAVGWFVLFLLGPGLLAYGLIAGVEAP